MHSSARTYTQLLKHRGFTSLLMAQLLGVFNDAAFKTTLSIFIISKAVSATEVNLKLTACGILFVLPYVLFSSYAGQVADRYSKRKIIIWTKVAEGLVMAFGFLAMMFTHIPLMFAMLFMMGLVSVFATPAREGILPEMLPDEDLSRANGLLQLGIYGTLFAGPLSAGLLLPLFPERPFITSLMLMALALAGYAFSLNITRVAPSGYLEKFHWNWATEWWRDFGEIRNNRPLLFTVLGLSYFWLLGAAYTLGVLIYGRGQLHLGNHSLSVLNGCVCIGIGVGAVVAGKLSADKVEQGLVPIGSIGMAVFGLYVFIAGHSYWNTLVGVSLLGFFGGVYLVPLKAFLQQRASTTSKGRAIAVAYAMAYTAVFIGWAVLWFLSGPLKLRPNQIMLLMAAVSVAVTVYVLTLLPDFMIRLVLWLLTNTLYRIQVRGIENLPKRGPAVLVCNHISFVDPYLIAACTQRFISFMMYRRFYNIPGIHWFARLMRAIPVSEKDPPRLMVKSLQTAQQHLNEGRLVCLFAEGATTRTGNLLRFRRGFEHIMRGQSVPIIPIHIDRVWGSAFHYERGRIFFRWPKHFPYPVTVSFGRPLSPQSKVFEVRQAVMRLGAEAFAERSATQRPLQELLIDSTRRSWRRFAMADSNGREINFGRVLVGAMVFRKIIQKMCPEERMIGVLLPPTVPTALLNLGISLAGHIPVNLNYTASQESIAFAIQRCHIKTIFTSPKLLERFSMTKLPGMVMLEDVAAGIKSSTKLLNLLAARLLPRFVLHRWLMPRGVTVDSLATVIFSSGSTGEPKGVMLNHRNIVSNLEGIQQAINVDSHDRLLGILPFFHVFGFTVALWLPALSGFGVIYHSNPLEAKTIGDLCRKYGVTIMICTPTFCWEYVRRCHDDDFKAMRLAIVGAEKMKPELAQAFKKKFGLDLYEGYGCTELSPVVAVGTQGYISPQEQQIGYKPGTIGHPIPGVAVRIVDLEKFEDLPPGKEGMLLVKSPGVMMGYLDEPELTRQTVLKDGWYVTGDIARMDNDGFVTITDRLSRFSKIGGEMVPHIYVEDALHRMLGAVEPQLAVTSTADGLKGEKLVVLYTDASLNVEDLLRRLRENQMPRLWLPRKENFHHVNALPTLGSGKLDLKRLKDMARELTSPVAVG
ncbi:MAG: acyl-[ACP]--phospholipid O-acyltransferase [Acidobacteriia bacterium]|nr:acyl-[ACP]--phospholipid O-acyltransferase [Terriglobia bacterium]